jgi:histidine triad (HIT) family protein
METIFSRIVKKEIPAKIVFEDEEILAFYDIEPQAPIHIVLIPKKAIPTLNAATAADTLVLGKMMLTASKIAKDLDLAEDGYRLVMNTNKNGGQTVFHIHLHLLAGRPMSWPPG